jgi:predicted deacylase
MDALGRWRGRSKNSLKKQVDADAEGMINFLKASGIWTDDELKKLAAAEDEQEQRDAS